MSDNLRTRIAKALYGQIRQPVPPFDDQPDEVQAAWLEDADAVIAELPVIKALPQRVEWRADFGYDGYAKCETRDEAQEQVDDFNEALGDDIRDGEQAMVMYRYVTEWIATDE